MQTKEEILAELSMTLNLEEYLDEICFDRNIDADGASLEELRHEILDWANHRATSERGTLATRAALA